MRIENLLVDSFARRVPVAAGREKSGSDGRIGAPDRHTRGDLPRGKLRGSAGLAG